MILRSFLKHNNVKATDSEIRSILKESIGYPLGVMITARLMAGGRPFTMEIAAQAFQEVYTYFEEAVFLRFDLPMRRFLLELSPFESFDLEMARMVTGDPHAGKLLDWLLRKTTMLLYDDVQRFRFWPQFRSFLLWKVEQEYTEEKRRALLAAAVCIMSLKKIMLMLLTAIPRAMIIPKFLNFWCVMRSCTREWVITAKWKNIIEVCLKKRDRLHLR